MPYSNLSTAPRSEPTLSAEDLEPLSEVERKHILHALEACHGQRNLAARALRIDRKTLYRRLRSYGL